MNRLSILLALAVPAGAQTDLRGWHADGQTWLVWEDDQTFQSNESYDVYASSGPIGSLARPHAQATGVDAGHAYTVHSMWLDRHRAVRKPVRTAAARALGRMSDPDPVDWRSRLAAGTNYLASPATLTNPERTGLLDRLE